MIKYKTFQIIIIISAILMLISCETGNSTAFEEKLVMFSYAQADSTIDSLYLSRSGEINDVFNFVSFST